MPPPPKIIRYISSPPLYISLLPPSPYLPKHVSQLTYSGLSSGGAPFLHPARHCHEGVLFPGEDRSPTTPSFQLLANYTVDHSERTPTTVVAAKSRFGLGPPSHKVMNRQPCDPCRPEGAGVAALGCAYLEAIDALPGTTLEGGGEDDSRSFVAYD
ncbi:hypothetical protein DCS_06199 [Drechmeria coniospora]|uniref:Uncharacterized protein n=1 Tax=Drechmeria coniospora TaxID=98403 RepID=A0A151GAX6_DRECN|nr:hypothetical protein DCS_06199 [Drechmeria coniospora]KYK54242.1 hypothetical protein DCS_06199 [Drechmeria coniospora]